MKTDKSVLHVFDKDELQALIDQATFDYTNSLEGYDAYFKTDAKTGMPIGGFRTGAYIHAVVTNAFDLIPVYLDHIDRGYTLHPEGTQAGPGASFTIAFWKSEAEQQADLAAIHAQVESDYNAEIAAQNKLIVDRVVAQRVAAEEKKEAAALEKKRGTRYAALEKEVISALRGDKHE